MGIFDFLFRKKNKQERNITFEEYKPQERIYNTDIIVEISSELNMAHNVGNLIYARHLCRNLYMEVSPHKQGGKVLINLPSNQCQVVGLAFTTIALRYNFGDNDLNSVAAENAYYCLAKNIIEDNNRFVAPAIFSILYEEYSLMREKLISSYCRIFKDTNGINICSVGNPFRDLSLEDFRMEAIKFKDYIMYYALSKFYDIENKKYSIPTDMPYFIPQENVIIKFLERINKTDGFSEESFIQECEKHFRN